MAYKSLLKKLELAFSTETFIYYKYYIEYINLQLKKNVRASADLDPHNFFTIFFEKPKKERFIY